MYGRFLGRAVSGTGHRPSAVQHVPVRFSAPGRPRLVSLRRDPCLGAADARLSHRLGFHLAPPPSRSGARCRGAGPPAGAPGADRRRGRVRPGVSPPGRPGPRRRGASALACSVAIRVVLRCPGSPARLGSLRTRAESDSRWRWRSSALTVCRSPSIGRCWPTPTPTWPSSRPRSVSPSPSVDAGAEAAGRAVAGRPSARPGGSTSRSTLTSRWTRCCPWSRRSCPAGSGSSWRPGPSCPGWSAAADDAPPARSARSRRIDGQEIVRGGAAGAAPPAATRRRSTCCPARRCPSSMLDAAREHDVGDAQTEGSGSGPSTRAASSRTSRCATTCTWCASTAPRSASPTRCRIGW